MYGPPDVGFQLLPLLSIVQAQHQESHRFSSIALEDKSSAKTKISLHTLILQIQEHFLFLVWLLCTLVLPLNRQVGGGDKE